jgi:PEP-CTERM motif
MRRVLMTAAAMAAMVTATPALAAITINGDGSITTSGTSGGSAVINLNGMTDGPTVIAGLTGILTLTFTSVTNSGTTYNFAYSMLNSSSAPITASRISSFGFNTNPNVTGGSATGTFDVLHLADAYPIIADPEVCVFNPNGPGGVCTGSGGGIDIGQTGTGTLSLNLASALSSITLSNFVDRYQSIAGAGNVTSAVGIQTPPVPEPATWALMLLGFGGVGMALRRSRKQNGRLLQIA